MNDIMGIDTAQKAVLLDIFVNIIMKNSFFLPMLI